MAKLHNDASALTLIAFAAADNGKSLFSQDTRDILATCASGSFVDLSEDIADLTSLLALAGKSKLDKADKALKQKWNAAIARAVKRDNDKRTVAGFRFIADNNNKPVGYGVLVK